MLGNYISDQNLISAWFLPCDIVDRDMVWKLGKPQSACNDLRFDVGTVHAMHKYFVLRLLI